MHLTKMKLAPAARVIWHKETLYPNRFTSGITVRNLFVTIGDAIIEAMLKK